MPRIGRHLAAFVMMQGAHAGGLVRWMGRRRPPEGAGYSYDGQSRLITWVALGLTLLEGGIVDTFLFFKVGGWVAVLVLAVHVYVVFLMLGTLASGVVRPHLVTDRALLLRQGSRFEVAVPLCDVERVVSARGDAMHAVRWRQLEDEVFELPISRQTNVTIHLLPGAFMQVREREVAAGVVHFYADQPRVVVAKLSAATQAHSAPR